MNTNVFWQRLSVLGWGGVLLAVGGLLVGCASSQVGPTSAPEAAAAPGGDTPTPVLRYQTDIRPLAEAGVPLLTQDTGIDVTTWEGLLRGSDQGPLVIPFDAANSLLVQAAEEAVRQAEEGGAALPTGALTAEDIDRLRAWVEAGAPSDDGAVAYAEATDLLYVANQSEASVSIIDMATNTIVRTVDLTEFGFTEEARPHHTAVDPDGAHWYVSLIGASQVLKFNRANELVGRVPFETPGMLAAHPQQDQLFVGRSMMAVSPPQRIGAIGRSAMAMEEEVDVFFPRPHAIAIHPNGEVVYTASLVENRILAYEIADEAFALSDVPGRLHTIVQFAISPDGQRLVATGQMSSQALIFDLSDPLNPVLTDSVAVGKAPWHPVFAPDGRRVFFGNKDADTVTVLDAVSGEVIHVIEGMGLAEPHGSALSPDGRYLYVSNRNTGGGYAPRYPFAANPSAGTVVVIDTETYEIVKVLEVGRYPAGINARGA